MFCVGLLVMLSADLSSKVRSKEVLAAEMELNRLSFPFGLD